MIKFYAWESSFKSSVMALRDKEAAILRSLIWWQALFSMVLFSGPVMMAVAVFATYALAGEGLHTTPQIQHRTTHSTAPHHTQHSTAPHTAQHRTTHSTA
jgi:hypothetical protein